MNHFAAAIAIFVLAIATGCDEPGPGRFSLPGRYVCVYPYGTEILTLQSDGTYIQIVNVKGTAQLTATGKWELRDNQMHLYDIYIVDDGLGHPASKITKSNLSTGVSHSTSGEISLLFNPDHNFRYKKE